MLIKRMARMRDFLQDQVREIFERFGDSASRAAKNLGAPDGRADMAHEVFSDHEEQTSQLARDAGDETSSQLKGSLREQGIGRIPQTAGEKMLEIAERVERKIQDIEQAKQATGWFRTTLGRINWGVLGSWAAAGGVLTVLGVVGYHYRTPDPEPPQRRGIVVNLNMPKIPTIPESNVDLNKQLESSRQLSQQTEALVKESQEYMRWQDQQKIELSSERMHRMQEALARAEPIKLQPVLVMRLPPEIRAIAARPITVTVREPNQAPRTYQQTIGAVVTFAPDSVRPQIQQFVTEDKPTRSNDRSQECHVCGNRTITFSSFDGKSISISGFH
jgi:hypothetical protein